MTDKTTSPRAGSLVVAGFGVALAGVLLIVFSFLGWATDDSSTITVSGMGGVSGEAVGYDASMVETAAHATGVWTIVFGVLLLVAAVGLIFRIMQPIAAVFAGLIGVAALITTLVFFLDPSGIVDADNAPLDSMEITRGTGLWLILIGGIMALVAGGAAAALAAGRGRAA